MTDNPLIGIIGGSGIYSFPGLENPTERQVDTPFGKPSSPIITGYLEGRQIAFLARHGTGHVLPPSEVPYRANIYALKSMGVERVVSISSCGSLRDDYKPGHIAIPDQLFDFTRGRAPSFFEGGLAAHISIADPFCNDLSEHVYQAGKSSGATTHKGGALITIEGPRFSTRMESNTYRSWGLSIINMTSAPEAFLAREAEMCYAVMNHVTDFDVWHLGEQPVTAKMLIETLNRNIHITQEGVLQLVRSLPTTKNCSCDQALANALITRPEAINDSARQRLSLLITKYVN